MKEFTVKTKISKNYDYDEVKDYEFNLVDNSTMDIIGTASGYLVKLDWDEEPVDEVLLDIADSISGDFCEAVDIMFHGSRIWTYQPAQRFFYLDRIEINENLRNKGLGTKFLNEISKHINKKVDLMLLTVSPTEIKSEDKEKFDKYRNKLKSFYIKQDFDTVHCIDTDTAIALKLLGD